MSCPPLRYVRNVAREPLSGLLFGSPCIVRRHRKILVRNISAIQIRDGGAISAHLSNVH